MIKYQYKTFLCEVDDLQDALSQLGLEGWRLHTCEPVIRSGPYGPSPVKILVVMDQVVSEEELEEIVSEGASEGIAMKG